MSAILSTEDLNDFITPGVACIKPVETLPAQQPDASNPYEVTTEDKVEATNAAPASISLTDCLACSGCVTSAEAVLVSLQSHAEVLSTLDAYPELVLPWQDAAAGRAPLDGKIFVASVSPQSRASIAATYGVTDREAEHMIAQLLSGPDGLRATGKHGSGFTWVIDTNVTRQVALVAAADEVRESFENNTSPLRNRDRPKRPILTSACPGWICYAEKTHPHILPHISRVKSPQALMGTLLKSVLANKYGVSPDKIWHLAIMPCFDKKLEASRGELTDMFWRRDDDPGRQDGGVRDVDCVITARELLMLADSRGIRFPSLPRVAVPKTHSTPFPDPAFNSFLFPPRIKSPPSGQDAPSLAQQTGTSGGFLWHIMRTMQTLTPGSEVTVQRGRNPDVAEYSLTRLGAGAGADFKSARYYGFRNIQNLVRKLKPVRESRLPGARARASRPAGNSPSDAMSQYAYVEVMACPGGCTNGGGQIKVGDVGGLRGTEESGVENGSAEQFVAPTQKAWLGKVDEAYFSADSVDEDDEHEEQDQHMDSAHDLLDVIDGISRRRVHDTMAHWADITGVELDKLVYTTYRRVESDVGKKKVGDAERVAGLASSIGGGW